MNLSNVKLILALGIILLQLSCKSECNCTEEWDEDKIYVANDLVNHNGECYEASAQGKGITPGPWQQNGNDIWMLCVEE